MPGPRAGTNGRITNNKRRLLALSIVFALLTVAPSVSPQGAPISRAIDRVSVTSAGAQTLGSSYFAGFPPDRYISGDGRHVAFQSEAQLTSVNLNGWANIYVRDRLKGTTALVSIGSSGSAANENSFTPVISDDGRFVAFMSLANNLVPNDTNSAYDIFVHDRDADGNGVFDEPGGTSLTRVSVSSNGTESNCDSERPSISADGRYVAFDSCATNWVEVLGKPQAVADIFVHDMQTGATIWASPPLSGSGFNNHHITNASISADGRWVAFESPATTHASAFLGESEILVRDTCIGAPSGCAPSTDWVSPHPAVTPVGSHKPSMSADGRFVAFESDTPNLVLNDTNDARDIFVFDRQLGVMARVNVSTAGLEATTIGPSACQKTSLHASISGDGRFVTFESCANNLDPADTLPSNFSDIFLHDRDADGNGVFDEPGGISTALVSRTPAGAPANRSSNNAAISSDGRVIAFASFASDLTPTAFFSVDIFASAPAGLSINDVSTAEGNSGTANLTFTVTLFPASSQAVTVDFTTADGTATVSDNDYVAASGSLTFNPGEVSKQVAVVVNGDTKLEPDETFVINLSNPINAQIAKPQGVATIRNDEQPGISIDDVSVPEGNAGVTSAVFSVRLSAATSLPVTVNFTTADGSATMADDDYAAHSGTLTFNPGEITKQITVTVNGDTRNEPDETFLVNLSNATNATLTKAQGIGTIENDDGPVVITVNETIFVQDAPALLPSRLIAVNESISVQDAPGLLPSAMFTVNESISVLDGPAVVPAALINVSESVTVSDAPSVANSPAGTDVISNPVDVRSGTTPVKLTFQTVTQPGLTSLTTSDLGPPPPTSFGLGNPPVYYDLSTTAVFSGSVAVCINYSGISFPNALGLGLFHFENGVWVNRTVSLDPAGQTICASVTSLSPFAIFAKVNHSPVANAGVSQVVECAGPSGTPVTLDGSASTDSDSDPLSYVWTDAAGAVVGTAARVSVVVPLGVHAYTLTVSDGHGGISSASVNATVRDTTPPAISIAPSQVTVLVNAVPVTRATLGLPAPVASDTCDPNPQITDDAPSSFSAGTYTITFTATDASGNSARTALTVNVQLRLSVLNAAVVVTQFRQANSDVFGAEVTVQLGSGNDGINPSNDAFHFVATGGPVLLAVDLPFSAFRRLSGGTLVFTAPVNGLPTDIALKPLGGGKYVLVLAITKATLRGFANPVTIELGLGSDTGRVTTNAFILKK